jgi:ADP-ribosylglycohydrolase/protein-tyrosine phosphatase
MIGGGPLDWAPGEWTDDTEMAICIGRIAAVTPDLDHPAALAAVGDAFLQWAADARDVGNQTRAVLDAARSGAELPSIARDYFDRGARAAGNGSLMRTAPVALAYLGDDAALAEVPMLVSALTHGDPLAGEACVLWCTGIDRAVRAGRTDGVRDGIDLLPADRRGFWSDVLTEAEQKGPTDFSPNGYVVRALQAAWSALTHGERASFDDVLRSVVAGGDDADTIGAIVGQLLGAARGASTLPFRWTRLLHGWPGWRDGDLVRLGAAIGRHEGDWTTPWGAGDFPPVVVPLAEDPDVLIGNIEALAGVDTEAFVSLCRLRAEQVRPPHHHEVWLVDDATAMAPRNLDAALVQAVEAIETFRSEGHRVFVHCVSGVSRTGAVAALYLARRLGVSGLEGLDRVRRVRPSIAPNSGLIAALRRLAP